MSTSCDKTDLWNRYWSDRSIENRNEVVNAYLHVTRIRSKLMKNRVPLHIQIEDLEGAACIGLIQSVERFFPGSKVKFESFCGLRVDGSMLDWLKETGGLTRAGSVFVKSTTNRYRQHFAEYGEPLLEEECFEQCGYNANQNRNYTAMLNIALPSTGIVDVSDSQYRCAMDVDDECCSILKRLLPVTRDAVILHLKMGFDLKQVGQLLKKSSSRIGQLIQQAKQLVMQNGI